MSWQAARRTKLLAAAGALAALAACAAPPTALPPTIAPPTAVPPTATQGLHAVTIQPIAGGPVLLRSDMSLQLVAQTGGGATKLAYNPADGKLYYLTPTDGVYQVDLSGSSAMKHVAAGDAFPGGASEGLAF